MKLVQLLTTLDSETFARLAHQHLDTGEIGAMATTCVNLEGAIRSPQHIRETMMNVQPPAFKLIELLLDAPDHSIPTSGLRETVNADTAKISEAMSSGELLGKERATGIALYLKMLAEARRSGLHLDPAESSLLGVLRRELGLRQAEHFLIAHHKEMATFWQSDHGFLDAMSALRTAGLLFVVDRCAVIPDDVVPRLRPILGLEMSAAARTRLFEKLSNSDLATMLSAAQLRSSGTQDAKTSRLLESYVQPSDVLSSLPLPSLRELCKAARTATSGNKDELCERIVRQFATGADVEVPIEEPEPPPPEPRELRQPNFEQLLLTLRQQDLGDILESIGARRTTGSKEQLIGLVLESGLSEGTILLQLDATQLDLILRRLQIRQGGTKRERIARLLAHFAEWSPDTKVCAD